MFFSKE